MVNNVDELDDALYARVVAHSDEGNRRLEEDDDIPGAIAEYEKALALLPIPFERWEAALWLLIALGDAHFLKSDYAKALEYLAHAVQCPDALGNPFLHLRLGQTFFELGQLDKAADEMARAYMGEGPDVFADEDPKYFAFLKTRMRGIG